MKCPHCHRTITKGVAFCPYCGTKLKHNRFSIHNSKILRRKMKPSNKPDSPRHITKKAKAVLAGLFAVVVIGGVTAHHIHYIHSPQSVNLKSQFDNHVYKWSSPSASDITGSSGSNYLGGVFHWALIANSDVALSQGNLKGYSLSNNNIVGSPDSNSSSDIMGYDLSPHMLELSDQGPSNSDTGSDTDSGNYVKYRLHSISRNHKRFVFYPYSVRNKNQNAGVPYRVSHKDSKHNSLIMTEKKTLHTQ